MKTKSTMQVGVRVHAFIAALGSFTDEELNAFLQATAPGMPSENALSHLSVQALIEFKQRVHALTDECLPQTTHA